MASLSLCIAGVSANIAHSYRLRLSVCLDLEHCVFHTYSLIAVLVSSRLRQEEVIVRMWSQER